MAWGGTLSIDILTEEAIRLVFTALDADNEETYTLSPLQVGNQVRFQPTHARIFTTNAQAGLTFDIALQGSLDGTNWVDLVTATAKDTHYNTIVDYTSATGDPTPAGYSYFRVFAADVTDGAATSHTVTVLLFR